MSRIVPCLFHAVKLLAILLLPSLAWAQGQSTGYQMAPNCSLIPSPVPNKLLCWNETTKVLYYWNGSAYVPLTGGTASVTSVTGIAPIVAAPTAGNVQVSIANTAVTPGPYGSATQTVALTFDAKGRATSAANVTIAITPSQITCTSGIFQGGSPAACGPLNQAITNSQQTIDYKVYRSTGDPNPLNVNAGASILQTWTGAGADGGAFLSQVDLQATASGVVSPSGIFTGCRTAVEGSDCWGLIATINPAVTLANPQGHAIGALLRGLAGPNVVGIGIISEAVSGHASSGLEVGNTVAGTNEFLKGVWVSAAQDYGLLIGATAGRSIPTNPIALILADGVTKPWYLDATGFQTITRTTAAAAQALLLAVNSGSSVGDGATLDWQHSASERSARIYARALSTNVGQLRLAIGNNAGGYTDVLQVGAGVSVGTATDPGAGLINALTGFRIGNAAASGTFLRGNGTNYVASAITVPNAATTGDVLAATGTNVVGVAARGQLPATATNDDAASGKLGEFLESTVAQGSAVSLTTATNANITSVNLSAGDWDVWVQGVFLTDTTTQTTLMRVSSSPTTATEDTTAGHFAQASFPAATVLGNVNTTVWTGPKRYSLSGAADIFAVARSAFTVSTASVWGAIRARRVR